MERTTANTFYDQNRLQTVAAAIILLLLSLLIYANTFTAPFIYDDTNNILTNPHIRMTAVTVDEMTDVIKSPSATRPLANLTLALNYFFSRYDVRSYHLVNLIIHIFTAWLVFLVGRQTLQLSGTTGPMVPVIAAALWLVNPVHTQSVTYIVQRMNSLAAMFYLLAMFCYIRGRTISRTEKHRFRKYLFYLLCPVAGVCGLASKEIVATLPFMLFVYEWYFFQNLDRKWCKRKLAWIVSAGVIIFALALLYLGNSPIKTILLAYQKHDFTPAQRLLTEPAVIIYYIGLILFPSPHRLSLIYDFPVASSFFDPATTALAMMGLVSLIVAAVLASKSHRLFSFAVIWYIGNLLIESSIFGLSLVFEHRTYLPSVFLFIALTAAVLSLPGKRVLAIVMVCIVIFIFGFWTRQRNTVWNDSIRFWQDNVSKAPNDTTVLNNLGQALLVAGKTKAAEIHFNRAAAIAPDCEHFNNLGLAAMKTGNLDAAINFFHQALHHGPRDANTHFNLGTVWFQKQDMERARHHLTQAARFASDPVLALNNLTTVLVIQKKYDEAITVLNRLGGLLPESPAVPYNLACVYSLQGKKKKAVTALQQAVKMGYNRWDRLQSDMDLKNIHDTDYFKSLIKMKTGMDSDNN